jgi:hypothetical protein
VGKLVLGNLLTAGPAVSSAELDEMRCGQIYLSVPLLHDVIQVGARGELASATIEVSRTATSLAVRRMDRRRLQAQILHEKPGYAGPTVRTTVFREPVEVLYLEIADGDEGSRRWFAAGGVRVDRQRDLEQFVRTIATFGLAKQRVALTRAP